MRVTCCAALAGGMAVACGGNRPTGPAGGASDATFAGGEPASDAARDADTPRDLGVAEATDAGEVEVDDCVPRCDGPSRGSPCDAAPDTPVCFEKRGGGACQYWCEDGRWTCSDEILEDFGRHDGGPTVADCARCPNWWCD